MQWTKAARARLLPYPGHESWTVCSDLRESSKALAKAGLGPVPDEPELAPEVERGVAARLDQRYNLAGNHPKDTLPRDLIDLWVGRRGVVFATEVVLAIAETCPPVAKTFTDRPYDIRWDGQPWARLREHLFASGPGEFAAARQLAARARTKPAGALRFALSYAFCEPNWVDADLDDALDQGRGPLCVIAAIADPIRAEAVVRRMMDPSYRKYELIEEAVQHMPCVMSRLGDAGADLILEAAAMAWNKPSRKPWLELVRCYETPEAHAFVAAHR